MENVIELTDDNYELNTSTGLFLVDIWAPWCGPCKLIAPLVEQLAVDYMGKVSVGKLNADDNGETVSKLGVKGIPTLFLYKDGVVVDKLVGLVQKNKLYEMIEKHLDHFDVEF